MNWLMYFHHTQFPKAPELQSIKCGNCGRVLFKANTKNIVVVHDIGVPVDEYPPGQHLIEVKCHSCRTMYKVLFQ